MRSRKIIESKSGGGMTTARRGLETGILSQLGRFICPASASTILAVIFCYAPMGGSSDGIPEL